MLFSGAMLNESQVIDKIRKNVKKIRQKKGLNHGELGALFNPPVDKQVVQRIESGGTTPTLKTLIKIANALGVKLEELIG